MAKLVFDVVFGENGRSITSSGDDGHLACSSLDVRVKEVFRTPGESQELEHAGQAVTTHQYTHLVAYTRYSSVVVKWKKGLHAPIPQDGFRLSDRITIRLAALRYDIDSKSSIGNAALVRRRTGPGVLVGGDIVDRENELDILRLGLFYKVKEGVADLRGPRESGKGRKGWCTDVDAFEYYTTSDNERVDLDRKMYVHS
jgi:hypothetical protein